MICPLRPDLRNPPSWGNKQQAYPISTPFLDVGVILTPNSELLYKRE